MKEPQIVREEAEREINDFLDFKDIFEPNQEQKTAIETLVQAIMYGRLEYNEQDKTFLQKLKNPLGEGGIVTQLKYRARLNDNHVQKFMKGVPHNDPDQRVNAYIAALTDQARGIIGGLDYVDKRVANAITTFFF